VSEIDIELCLSLNGFVATHLGTIVESHCLLVASWNIRKACLGCGGECRCRAMLWPHGSQVATLPFHECGNATAVAFADNGVTLPMAVGLASENVTWSGVNAPKLLLFVPKGLPDAVFSSPTVFPLAAVQVLKQVSGMAVDPVVNGLDGYAELCSATL
jgi:hypothetical protein